MILTGDCVEVMVAMEPESVDAIVTDPPYGLEFMGKEWDRLGAGVERSDDETDPFSLQRGGSIPFGAAGQRVRYGGSAKTMQAWHEAWAREALRVAKPGAHLLAFGGTRTYHRLAAAIEDAGWEIRDCLVWAYASGFPKSLDVSKAIDKAAGAEREVVGAHPMPGGTGPRRSMGDGWQEAPNLTAPATDAARDWDGWGTALKPAWEPIVMARKPLRGTARSVLAVVESSLREAGVEGDIRWRDESVSGAASTRSRPRSSSTPAQPAAGTSAASAGARGTPSGELPTPNSSAVPGSGGATGIPSGLESTPDSTPANFDPKSSPLTEADAPAAGSASQPSSPSTTSTAGARPTGAPSTGRSTPSSNGSGSQMDTESYAGTATGLTGSLAHVLIRRAADGYFIWPEGLPKSVGGASTVAANVLAHGTGALNIAGTRIGTDDTLSFGSREIGTNGIYQPMAKERQTEGVQNGAGRWPANVILTHPIFDGGIPGVVGGGTSTSGAFPGEGYQRAPDSIYGPASTSGASRTLSDSGTYSRFFLIPKSSRSDREPVLRGTLAEKDVFRGNLPDNPKCLRCRRQRIGALGADPCSCDEPQWAANADTKRENLHPTVKPVELMRHLVRLVTPPGGTVLDCFLGSGTTAIAAELEGFAWIGIEREAEYVAIAEARLNGTQKGMGI